MKNATITGGGQPLTAAPKGTEVGRTDPGITSTQTQAHRQCHFLVAGLLLLLGCLGLATTAGAATVKTDRLDYPPFSDVYIDGTGFTAGETVTVHIDQVNLDGSLTPVWDADPSPTADAMGWFTVVWFIDSDEFVGDTLRVTATGQTSMLVL